MLSHSLNLVPVSVEELADAALCLLITCSTPTACLCCPAEAAPDDDNNGTDTMLFGIIPAGASCPKSRPRASWQHERPSSGGAAPAATEGSLRVVYDDLHSVSSIKFARERDLRGNPVWRTRVDAHAVRLRTQQKHAYISEAREGSLDGEGRLGPAVGHEWT